MADKKAGTSTRKRTTTTKKSTETAAEADQDKRVADDAEALLQGNVGSFDDFTPEDLARGYRVGTWNGFPNFEVLDGSNASLDEAEIQEHVRKRGLDTILAKAREKFGAH